MSAPIVPCSPHSPSPLPHHAPCHTLPPLPRWYWQCTPSRDGSAGGGSAAAGAARAAPQAQPLPQAATWAPCGGVNGPGGQDAPGAVCPSGSLCLRSDRWFWQCQPATPGAEKRLEAQAREQAARAARRERVERLRAEGVTVAPLWAACGGLNGPGGRDAAGVQCVPGAACTRNNK